MTPPTPENYRPLATWPELVQAFVADLATVTTHAEATALLAGLDHADKTLIFQSCPPPLQRRLWQLKQEVKAA